MGLLSKASWKALYGLLGTIFADNTTEEISEGDMRQFGEDGADSLLFRNDDFIDEDSFATDSATKVPSQQSVKAYVDNSINANLAGLNWKQSVKCATTAALPTNTQVGLTLVASANGAFPSQDGISVSLNESILVKNEPTGSKNGLYTLTQVGSAGTPWILTRRSDNDTTPEMQNAVVSVDQGTANADTSWRQSVDNVTVGSSSVMWVSFGSSGINNTAANNELMKSDGTHAVPSGIFSTAAGNVTLGGAGTSGSSRQIGVAGSLTDIGIQLIAKLSGAITLAAENVTIGGLVTTPFTVINGSAKVKHVNNASSVGTALTLSNENGSPTLGIGVALEFASNTNNTPNLEIGAKIEAVTTNVGSGTENFDLVFKTMGGGFAAAEAVRIKSDKSTSFSGPVVFPSYTVAGVPSASSYTGGMIYVSNETGGAVMAFSDGTNWRRVTDRAVIS